MEPQPAPLPSLTWDGPSTQGGLLLSPQILSASTSAGTLPETIPVPRAKGASPQHLPPVGRGKAQAASWIWANQSPRSSMSSFPLEVSSGGQCWGGQGGQPGRLQVSEQVNSCTCTAPKSLDKSRKDSKATNLTHPPG